MPEWLMIASMAVGGIGFAAGGTHIPGIGGQKWIRRFLMTFLLAGIGLLNGFLWWKCLIYFALLTGVMHLPYGERTQYWQKAIVFVSFALPALIFGWTWWMVISPFVIFGLFWLSNILIFERIVVHKIWEFVTGVLIGIILSTVNVW